MRNVVLGALAVCAVLAMTTTTQADGGWRAARRGPWIVYRYPLFREGNRPREVRGRSQEYFWPLNANEQYPRYYGGIHARELQDAGTPPGDRGFRGYAW